MMKKAITNVLSCLVVIGILMSALLVPVFAMNNNITSVSDTSASSANEMISALQQEQGVTFNGTAVEYFSSTGSSGWNVQVEEVSSGPSEIKSHTVTVALWHAEGVPSGTIDPDIEPGDKVAVYGLYMDDDYVTLSGSEDYYISKTSVNNQPSVTVRYPNGGESISIGTQVQVSAHATDDAAVTGVTFYYSRDGGSNWDILGEGARISGTATDGMWNRTWNTDGLSAGTNYSIKSVASDGTFTNEDQSEGTFTLADSLFEGTIIYHADHDAGIWRMIQDGTGKTQLSPHGWFAEYSPDNTKIAFGEVYHDGIFVMNADGTNQIKLTQSGNAPSWSPDGKQIAYHDGNTVGKNRRIWVMNADGTNVHQLSNNPGSFPTWSPNGNRIAYHGEVNNGIWLINPDGTGETMLYNLGGYPAWSLDGRKLAYNLLTDGCIWTMNANGTGKTKLTDHMGIHPTWSTNGTKIAYEGLAKNKGIWVINDDCSGDHIINEEGHAPDWSNESAANDPPVNPTLTSDKPEPQTAGTAITWTASATDPNGDTLYYRFWIKGPSTENFLAMKRDWSSINTWTWHTNSADIGDTDIAVWIRDGHHAPPERYDVEKIYPDYNIASGAVGAISVMSSPSGTIIELEGFVGPTITTPHTFTNVPVGTHTIKLSLEGYQDWSTSVHVIAGTTSSVHATLAPMAVPPSTTPQPSTGKTHTGEDLSSIPAQSGMISATEQKVEEIGGTPSGGVTGIKLWVLYNGAWTKDPAAIYYGEWTYMLIYLDQGQSILMEETYPSGWVDTKDWGYLSPGYHYYRWIADAVGWHKIVADGSITGQSNEIFIYVWPV